MATLFPERFTPPVGRLRVFGEIRQSSVDDQKNELKKTILRLVHSGYTKDTEIAAQVNKSENCVRSYLSMLERDGEIKKVNLNKPGAAGRLMKMLFFPVGKRIDIDQLLAQERKIKHAKKEAKRVNLHVRTVKRYLAALEGHDWLLTCDVRRVVGVDNSSVLIALHELTARKLVERRDIGGKRGESYLWRLAA